MNSNRYPQMTDERPLRKASFYGRVSGPDEESIDNQLTVARERAREEGFEIPDGAGFIFADVFVSGATTSRKQFDRLKKVIENGEAGFTRIYVRASDRFGRWSNPRMYDYFLVHFEQHGVEVHFCDVEKNLNFSEGVSDSDVGQYILDKCVNVNDARTRTDLIRKMRRAKRTRARNGFYPGGLAPYGFDRVLVHAKTRAVIRVVPRGERVAIDDCHFALIPQKGPTSDAVRTIFDCLDRGLSIEKTVHELNKLGYPSPNGEPWYASIISKIAYNPLYMGTLVWGARGLRTIEMIENPPQFAVDGRDPVVTHNAINEPHVSREQFLRVRRILGGNQALWERRRTSEPKYLFSGKILCAFCGSGYSGQRTGTTFHYRHNHSHLPEKRACPEYLKSLRIDRPDDYFLACVATIIADPHLHDRVAETINETLSADGANTLASRIQRLEERIGKGQDTLKRLENDRRRMSSESAREASVAESDAVGIKIDADRKRIRALRRRADLVQQQMPPADVARASISKALDRLKDESFTARRALVDHTVEWVKVRGALGDVEVAIRYP